MVQYLKQYIILFNKAKTDLKAAQILFEQYNDGVSELDLEIITFHLQQSAEKFIKAILSKNEIYYPKFHDLAPLLKLLNENSIDLETNQKLLIELNDYAVEGRYAVIHDDLDKTVTYIKELIKLSNIVNLRLQE
jgi:HEPN domain-containing protein